MRQAFRQRARASSISAVAPSPTSSDYDFAMATAATSILYLSPLPSSNGHPIYVLNSAALPDTADVEYDTLLPYVLARLPGQEDLIAGTEYEVVVFAGGNADSATSGRKGHPGVGWFIQAYHVLTRAMRKRIQKLYIVHERRWVRVLSEVFSTIASPKFRRKIVHASSLTQLAQHIDITGLLVPASAYLRDRDLATNIHVEHMSGRRAFSARPALPKATDGSSRLPRVLRETSSFILLNVGTEGLFRIPAHIKQKEILREAYDRGQKFIVWKERGTYLPQIRQSNTLPQINMDVLVQEIDPVEAYGVHVAAGLCKFWYSELRQPLFPATSYKDLRQLYGNTEEPITLEMLTDLLSPVSQWSILPSSSREILIRHLLPLLAIIASHSGENKMTPDNLAVCFAPTLCCGEDPMEDAKSSSVIRRVLAAAIAWWPQGLREACGTTEPIFQQDLQAPAHADDYEDPLSSEPANPEKDRFHHSPIASRPRSKDGFTAEQQTGILLRDNEAEYNEEKKETLPPPLPPRQQLSNLNINGASTPAFSLGTNNSPVPLLPPRSPAPNAAVSSATIPRVREAPVTPQLDTHLPPRYSQVMGADESHTWMESPSAYVTPANGFGPQRRGDWSFDISEDGHGGGEKELGEPERQDSQVRRKPVGLTPLSASVDVYGQETEKRDASRN